MGGGKSLCFRLPALCTPEFTLVVPPLRTLMTDQTDSLRRLGLCSVMFHGDMDADEKVQVLDRLQEQASEVKFVYTSSEQLDTNKSLLAVLKQERARQRLQSVVLDEAHCVGMWGDTFRCGAFPAMCLIMFCFAVNDGVLHAHRTLCAGDLERVSHGT